MHKAIQYAKCYTSSKTAPSLLPWNPAATLFKPPPIESPRRLSTLIAPSGTLVAAVLLGLTCCCVAAVALFCVDCAEVDELLFEAGETSTPESTSDSSSVSKNPSPTTVISSST